MATNTSIEWTEATWNPVRGCSRVSLGCENCYAERMAHRFSGVGKPYYGLTKRSASGPKWTGKIRLVPEALTQPSRWRIPRVIFVNSMSDLFHAGVPERFIHAVFQEMSTANWHTFQILTKRPDRALALSPDLPWPRNVWLGTSVETQAYTGRIELLRPIPAAIRFLSLEPLLGPIRLPSLRGINWVIVGGESGPGARPMEESWVAAIQRSCKTAAVPFFFKQWGGVRKKSAGRELNGRTWDEVPDWIPGEIGGKRSGTRRLRTL